METEVKLSNGMKILIDFNRENGYQITKVTCFRVRGNKTNKRQSLLDIIEGCKKELEVIYEHGE